MKLSDLENKTVAKLRKRQQFLRRWRVPLLIFHALCAVAWLVLLIVVSRFPGGDPTAKLIVVSYVLPPIYISLALHGFCFANTLNNWHGEPRTELLLRVVDDFQQHDS